MGKVVVYDYTDANFSAYDSIKTMDDGYYRVTEEAKESNAFINYGMFVV